MIATDFSGGTRILGPGLDLAVAKRVQNLRLAYESLLSRFVAAPSTVALAVDSTCSPNTTPHSCKDAGLWQRVRSSGSMTRKVMVSSLRKTVAKTCSRI